MKTKCMLTALVLILLLSCSSKNQDSKQDTAGIDSIAIKKALLKEPKDTLGLVGVWVATYPYYAYTVTVHLEISKGNEDCPYVCNWEAKDNDGGNKGKYRWCAQYVAPNLKGYGYFANEQASISIFKNDEKGNSIHVSVKYANRENPWDLNFTRSF